MECFGFESFHALVSSIWISWNDDIFDRRKVMIDMKEWTRFPIWLLIDILSLRKIEARSNFELHRMNWRLCRYYRVMDTIFYAGATIIIRAFNLSKADRLCFFSVMPIWKTMWLFYYTSKIYCLLYIQIKEFAHTYLYVIRNIRRHWFFDQIIQRIGSNEI